MKGVIELIDRAIQEKVFPGCVVGIRRGAAVFVHAAGRHTYDADSPVVTETSLYDVASVTKAVVTATLTHQLLASNALTLKSKLIDYVPEYYGGYRDEITIHHLLTYTVGGIRLSDFKDQGTDVIMKEALNLQPPHPPGTHFEYSNVPAFLLGIVVERILGPLDIAAKERIFMPFEMKASTFAPQGAVPTEIDERGRVQDIVHDESARVFRKAGKTVGHAGLFSTAKDLLTFLNAFHEGKMSANGAETNQIPALGLFTGLGWELNQSFMGIHRTPHTFGKTGFTGCSLVCDTHHRVSVVVLSNRTFPHRPADSSLINAFRKELCDIVFV